MMRTKYFFQGSGNKKYSVAEQYYAGEAIAGLVALHAIDDDAKWLELATRAMNYIVDKRDAALPDSKVLQDAWLVHAIDQMPAGPSKEKFLKHAWRVFTAVAYHFNSVNKQPDIVGSFYATPSFPGTARRLAMLATLWDVAKEAGEKQRVDRLGEMMQKGARFLLRHQYDEINTVFFTHPQRVRGAYMYSYWNPVVQIDSFQYGFMALLETRRIVAAK